MRGMVEVRVWDREKINAGGWWGMDLVYVFGFWRVGGATGIYTSQLGGSVRSV